MSSRAEFSEKTKRILACRAGYRCSVPECDQITVGPGAKRDEYALTGTACHVYAAADGRPRGTGGLSEDQRRTTSNGFWACENHGKLIDTNRGDKYSASLLLSYKALHEERISREQRGIHTPLGWFHELRIEQHPFFKRPLTIRLGKVTSIGGGNRTGKSALCECLAGVGDPSLLWRWRQEDGSTRPMRYEVTYFDPHPQKIELELQRAHLIRYRLNDQPVPIRPYPLRIVFLPRFDEPNLAEIGEIGFIADLLRVDAAEVVNLLPEACRVGVGGVSMLQAEREGGLLQLRGDLEGSVRQLRFGAWSHGERTRVLFSLAVAMARFHARLGPTLLLLDGGVAWLDSHWLERCAKELLAPSFSFQTVIVHKLTPGDVSWDGWQTIWLREGPGGVEASQEAMGVMD